MACEKDKGPTEGYGPSFVSFGSCCRLLIQPLEGSQKEEIIFFGSLVPQLSLISAVSALWKPALQNGPGLGGEWGSGEKIKETF